MPIVGDVSLTDYQLKSKDARACYIAFRLIPEIIPYRQICTISQLSFEVMLIPLFRSGYGTVHGAMEAGEREARRLLRYWRGQCGDSPSCPQQQEGELNSGFISDG